MSFLREDVLDLYKLGLVGLDEAKVLSGKMGAK